MQDVKKMFAEAGVENEELIASVEKAIKTVKSDNTVVEGIPQAKYNRKVAEFYNLVDDKAELQAKKENLEEKLSKANETIKELGQYKDQINEINEKRHEKILSDWNRRSKLFDIKKGDKLYDKVEKVKHRFNLGDDLDDSQIEHNLELLKTYDEVDYFKGDKTSTEYNNRKASGNDDKAKGDYYGYESAEQLAWKDPKLYEKWKTDKEK